jgi:hypothetical protein
MRFSFQTAYVGSVFDHGTLTLIEDHSRSLFFCRVLQANLQSNNMNSLEPANTLCDSSPRKARLSFLDRYQLIVPTVIADLASRQGCGSLADSFEPNEYDVVLGRGKGKYNRPGNKRFRAIVQKSIPNYLTAKTKMGKTFIFNSILDEVRSQDNGNARFVRYDTKIGWVEMGDDQVRDKVGHVTREAIAAMKKSHTSKTSIKQRIATDDSLIQPQDLFSQSMTGDFGYLWNGMALTFPPLDSNVQRGMHGPVENTYSSYSDNADYTEKLNISSYTAPVTNSTSN